jgi:hypothetical protein
LFFISLAGLDINRCAKCRVRRKKLFNILTLRFKIIVVRIFRGEFAQQKPTKVYCAHTKKPNVYGKVGLKTKLLWWRAGAGKAF